MPSVLLAAILLATIAAYSPVLFNFFAGDDFVHLTWLSKAVDNPELIWRNFHSSWLDGTATRFYRPLISVFMVMDYLVWKDNGLGFHLTNLVFHLLSSLFLFLIVFEISQAKKLLWPTATAALFALHPLHPEAVSWITGRVDAIVTAFVLASFWYYILWRRQGTLFCFFAAIATMMLALLSKEMAITLPALFIAWEFFINQKDVPTYGAKLLAAIKPASFFLLVLACYFVVRRIALGTFIGGYDNSLFFVADWRALGANWIHGLYMMLVPINQELTGKHHFLTKIWEVLMLLSLALAATTFARRQWFNTFAFIISWFALSLAPVYKLLAISSNLQGSRLAYLATAPLCALVTFALIRQWQRPRVHYFVGGTLLVLIVAGSILLWRNNYAWHQAGLETNAICLALARQYQVQADDPQVLFLDLPDNCHGAYVCRNALDGMLRLANHGQAISNAIMIADPEPILPFGYFKESLAQNKTNVHIWRWQHATSQFLPVIIPDEGKVQERIVWQGAPLSHVLVPLQDTKAGACQYSWLKDGSLIVDSRNNRNNCPALQLDFGNRACWQVEFIELTVQRLPGDKGHEGVDLFYAGDIRQSLQRRVHAELEHSYSQQKLLFPLRSATSWCFTGHCYPLQVLLPAHCHLQILSVAIVPTEEIMPQINFANSGYCGSKGFLHLTSKDPVKTVFLDASAIAHARAVQLEVTRANLTFESDNGVTPSQVIFKRLALNTTSGTITLKRELFPTPGFYEARAQATDEQGKQVGVAGDHIMVAVDP